MILIMADMMILVPLKARLLATTLINHDFDYDGYDDICIFKTETSGKDLVNDHDDHIFF